MAVNVLYSLQLIQLSVMVVVIFQEIRLNINHLADSVFIVMTAEQGAVVYVSQDTVVVHARHCVIFPATPVINLHHLTVPSVLLDITQNQIANLNVDPLVSHVIMVHHAQHAKT